MAFGLVGMAPFDELADEGDHRRHVVRRAGFDRRFETSKSADIAVKGDNGVGREVPDPDAPFQGRCVDLVVDIRDVAHIRDMLVTEVVAQQAEENIEDHQRPGVAKMNEVVDGWPAHVESGRSRLDGNQSLLAPGESIVERKRHEADPRNEGPISLVSPIHQVRCSIAAATLDGKPAGVSRA